MRMRVGPAVARSAQWVPAEVAATFTVQQYRLPVPGRSFERAATAAARAHTAARRRRHACLVTTPTSTAAASFDAAAAFTHLVRRRGLHRCRAAVPSLTAQRSVEQVKWDPHLPPRQLRDDGQRQRCRICRRCCVGMTRCCLPADEASHAGAVKESPKQRQPLVVLISRHDVFEYCIDTRGGVNTRVCTKQLNHCNVPVEAATSCKMQRRVVLRCRVNAPVCQQQLDDRKAPFATCSQQRCILWRRRVYTRVSEQQLGRWDVPSGASCQQRSVAPCSWINTRLLQQPGNHRCEAAFARQPEAVICARIDIAWDVCQQPPHGCSLPSSAGSLKRDGACSTALLHCLAR